MNNHHTNNLNSKSFSFSRWGVFLLLFSLTIQSCLAQENYEWLHFKPENGKSKNKKIVLISGDEEYRSEESLPMLAKILTKHHGFETVVLFAIDPSTKNINPEYQKNIPGLRQLEDADLMIIATRFRELPDNQMKFIDDYLKSGKPVIGLRTATHAFNFGEESSSSYKHYAYNEVSEEWQGGFGQQVLGVTWVNHHGDHGKEGTRAIINGLETINIQPILLGVDDIWGPSDVYGVDQNLKDATILLYGQPTLGMNDTAKINWHKSTLPIAWTKSYQLPGGKQGKAFTTTMGASVDFISEDLRRLIINASYWALDLEELINADLNVDTVQGFQPNMFGFGSHKKGTTPSDYR